jgi:hypothetical protein
MKSLQLVFRDPSDHGKTRTRPTPPTDVLHKQMCDFKDTWENLEHNGKRILPPAAIKEIHCLLVHIDRGCLSGILPGRGTNRNERLHIDIISHMQTNRYGVELVHALITTTLFTHNEKIRAKCENRCAVAINGFSTTVNENRVSFGLCQCTTSELLEPGTQKEAAASKVEMNTLSYRMS